MTLALDYGHGSVKAMVVGSDSILPAYPMALTGIKNDKTLEFAE